MNKGIELKIVRKILKASTKANIKNNCWIMFGFPGETFNDFNNLPRLSLACTKKNSNKFVELC